jgi:hypothetical protein
MKYILCCLACCGAFLGASNVKAGSAVEEQTTTATTATADRALAPVPHDIFTYEQAYVFESDLNHGGSFGKQDELQTLFEYGHRIQLKGNFYLHLGIAYDRYDFGGTGAPIPNHLQALAGVVGVDYMHGEDVGAFLQFRPGFYFENDINISSFDVPISAGTIFVVKEDKLYLFAGARASFLYGGFPVLPLAGVIWIPCDHVRLMGVVPEPRLVYSPNKNLNVWVGGELAGGSFRTDRNEGIQPGKLRGAQVDFADYRAGVGVNYTISNNFTANFGAGYSIQRNFDYARAGETYRTDPSPYVRLKFSAQF